MLFVDRYTAYHRGGMKTYHIEIVKQPLKDRVFHNLYHWYDMKVPIHIPGWQRVEKFLIDHGAQNMVGMWEGDDRKERWRDRLLSWPIKQDFRCYSTSIKNVERIARFEVEEEVYRACS